MERITMKNVNERAVNLNRRLEGSGRFVTTGQRNGYVALDEYRQPDGACMQTIMVGTKREVADFLHTMMVGIDLSRRAS